MVEPHMLGLDEIDSVLRGLAVGLVIRESRWAHQDSNLGPSDYESDALTN